MAGSRPVRRCRTNSAGARRRISRKRDGGHRRYEPFLFASAFTELDGLSVTIRQPLTVEDIVGRAFSMSARRRETLGARAEEFAAALARPCGNCRRMGNSPKSRNWWRFWRGGRTIIARGDHVAALQQIVTGQAKSITLLLAALVLFLYFLPSVLAFARGHRRFWLILVLQYAASPGPELRFFIGSFPAFSLRSANAHRPISCWSSCLSFTVPAGWRCWSGR